MERSLCKYLSREREGSPRVPATACDAGDPDRGEWGSGGLTTGSVHPARGQINAELRGDNSGHVMGARKGVASAPLWGREEMQGRGPARAGGASPSSDRRGWRGPWPSEPRWGVGAFLWSPGAATRTLKAGERCDPISFQKVPLQSGLRDRAGACVAEWGEGGGGGRGGGEGAACPRLWP